MSETPGADTLELERELRAKLPPPDASWLVRKRGYFYRGESSGYTGAKSQAGRYTEAEAKDIASIEPDCMSALRASEWPDDPMTLSPEVLRRLLDALASLRAEKEELRRERDEARQIVRDIYWMALRYADGRKSYTQGSIECRGGVGGNRSTAVQSFLSSSAKGPEHG